MARETTELKPRERYREESRRMILDAAREAFVRDGFASVSMRSLAEAVGLSHGSIYVYFRDKEALFDALVKQSFDELAAALQRTARIKDPVRFLKRAGRTYVEFALNNPGAYEFAFILRRPGPREAEGRHHAYGLLRAGVNRCILEKGLAIRDADAASQALWAAVHGIASLLILRPWFPWAKKEKLIAMVVDNAVDGLVASGTRKT